MEAMPTARLPPHWVTLGTVMAMEGRVAREETLETTTSPPWNGSPGRET